MTGYFGDYSEYSDAMGRDEVAVGEALAGAAAETGRPLVVHSMYPHAAVAATLRAGGVPVFRSIERAVGVLARLAEHGEHPPAGVPELPAPAAPVARPGYAEARALLEAGGVPFIPARIVASAAEAADAAAAIGYPVVLKALGALHKSDAGGVLLGLEDEAALRAAVGRLDERLGPPAYSVERLAPVGDGVELLIGARWDARFGPVALAGLGGVHTELLGDAAVALAPLGPDEALALLLSLRAAPLLQGARGRPQLDVDAAAAALAALSRVAAEHPEIAAIEVNPLLALPAGALGLDARLELA
jgi:acetate---CoA ligase (ADP-forming)